MESVLPLLLFFLYWIFRQFRRDGKSVNEQIYISAQADIHGNRHEVEPEDVE
jgi:hypothetical protein